MRSRIYSSHNIRKSQLAINFARQTRDLSPDVSVFWVPCSNRDRFEEAYYVLAQELERRGQKSSTTVVPSVAKCLDGEENGPWVMILDNMEDDNTFFTTQQFAASLPQSRNGSIILTSRNIEMATRIVGDFRNVFKVPAMEGNESHQLLQQKLGDKYNQEAATDLASTLQHIPLAIIQAAAFIRRQKPPISILTYQREFRARIHNPNPLYPDVSRPRHAESAPTSVATTLQISFEQIRRERPSAADLLSFMSFCSPQGIPESVLRDYIHREKDRAGDPDVELDEDLEVLDGYSLVTRAGQRNFFEIQPLVQFYKRAWLSTSDYQRWRLEVLRLMSHEHPLDVYENWAEWRILQPHIDSIIDEEPGDKEYASTWIKLISNVGWHRYRRGNDTEAGVFIQRALEVWERELGKEDRYIFTSIGSLVSSLQNRGKHEEAVKICRKAVESSRRVLGTDDTDAVAMTRRLASVLRDQGQYEEAETIYRQAWRTMERVYGSFDRDTLSTLSNLALVLYGQGKHDEAEKLYRQAYEAMKRYLGKDDRDTLESIYNLASALYAQGKYEEAEKMYRQAGQAMKKVLGKTHPDTLRSINNLASTTRALGRWKESEVLFKQVMETRAMVLGSEHPDTLTTMANLALTYGRQRRWKEAAGLGKKVIESRKRVLSEDHPDTITSMVNLAATFGNEGRWKEAGELFSLVMEARKRVLGEEHPDTVTSIANVASTYQDQGRWEEAEQLGIRVLEVRKRVLGDDHPDTLSSMAALAFIRKGLGHEMDAITLLETCLMSRQRILGPNNPDTIFTRSTLKKWKGIGIRDQVSEIDDSDIETSGASYSWPRPDSTNPSSLPYAGTADWDQVAKSRPPTTFFNYKMPEIERKPNKRDESDIQSVESISDDIESLVESQSAMADYRQAAVNYIVSKFAANSGLLALYQEAAQSMGEAKFVRNHRRLLKKLLLDLHCEGKSPSQKLAVEFLRSRSKRTHISLGIRNLVAPSDNTIREEVTLMLKQEKDNLFLLNRLLGEKDSELRPAPMDTASHGEPSVRFPDLDGDTTSEGSEESDNSSIDGYGSSDNNEIEIRGDDVLSNLEATADFLTAGRPFNLYMENLRRFLRSLPMATDFKDDPESDFAATSRVSGQLSHEKIENDPREDFSKNQAELNIKTPSSLWIWFMSIYSPPPVGYQRLLYTCVSLFPVAS